MGEQRGPKISRAGGKFRRCGRECRPLLFRRVLVSFGRYDANATGASGSRWLKDILFMMFGRKR